MLFGSTSRRFGTISIFPSIPIATYRTMRLLRKVVQVQMPGESTCRSRGAGKMTEPTDDAPLTMSVPEAGKRYVDLSRDVMAAPHRRACEPLQRLGRAAGGPPGLSECRPAG